ncbi:MAG: DNRLRE domain-containing protein [Caldilineales bacterium]|nr:DNRLRE domain-containing protein [Caldilineales bacterium]
MFKWIRQLVAPALVLTVLGASLFIASSAQADEISPAGTASTTVKTLDASWQLNPPTVDGNLNDWAAYQHYILDKTTASYPSVNNRPEPDDLSAWAAIVWDSERMYVAIHVVDDNIVRDSRNWYLDDMGEFSLDLDKDGFFGLGDLAFTISPDGLVTTNGGLSLGFQTAVKHHDQGWDGEFSVPLYQLGSDFLTNAEIGFTWGVQDDDGDGTLRYLVWEGTSARQPSSTQGLLRFVNGPTREWVAYRPGQSGFNGIEETTINSWPGNENKNFGTDPVMSIRGREQWHLLMKVTPPTLPPGARALDARLHFNLINVNNTGNKSNGRMYRMLNPWAENAATWFNADATTPWTVRGANGIGSDRSSVVISENLLQASQTEYVWELGSVIKDLYSHPENNHGFIFRGEDRDHVLFNFHSSECTASPDCAPWLEMLVEFPPPQTLAEAAN